MTCFFFNLTLACQNPDLRLQLALVALPSQMVLLIEASLLVKPRAILGRHVWLPLSIRRLCMSFDMHVLPFSDLNTHGALGKLHLALSALCRRQFC